MIIEHGLESYCMKPLTKTQVAQMREAIGMRIDAEVTMAWYCMIFLSLVLLGTALFTWINEVKSGPLMFIALVSAVIVMAGASSWIPALIEKSHPIRLCIGGVHYFEKCGYDALEEKSIDPQRLNGSILATRLYQNIERQKRPVMQFELDIMRKLINI